RRSHAGTGHPRHVCRLLRRGPRLPAAGEQHGLLGDHRGVPFPASRRPHAGNRQRCAGVEIDQHSRRRRVGAGVGELTSAAPARPRHPSNTLTLIHATQSAPAAIATPPVIAARSAYPPAPKTSPARYTAVSMKLLALYLASGSTTVNSDSR